ncbi:MAG: hypothetical protein M3N57_01570 [Actinomycetota bacterium]|nr:hypothetical protein [Actinomycetota bacterium]
MNGAWVMLLALIWGVVLLPGALRARRSSPTTSVGTFERAMDVLARRDVGAGGRYIYVPRDAGRIVDERKRRRSSVLTQRRRMFVRLLLATAVSLPLAFTVRGLAWSVFFGSAALLAGYVRLLLRWKRRVDRVAPIVRSLPDGDVVARDVGSDAAYAAYAAYDVGFDRLPVAVGAGGPMETTGGMQVARHGSEPWQPQSSVRIRRWDE